jgi:rod shape-determining protein MreD
VTARELLRLFLVVVLVLVVQYTFALDVRIGGAHPDLMLLLPIAAGVVGGPEAGAGVGFVAGMATDLFLPTPFGLSALVYCIIGFAVGSVMAVSTDTRRDGLWWLAPVVALAASAAGVMLYAVLGAVLGQPQMVQVNLATVVSVVAVVNAVLSPVAARLVAWGFDRPVNRRRRRRRLMSRSLGAVR